MKTLVTNQKKQDILFDVISGMDHGCVIPHEEIEKLIGESAGSLKYYSIVKKTNKSLLVIGKMIKSVHGQGYQVVNPGDYANEAISKFRQGSRRIKQGANILKSAPIQHMSSDELQIHRNVSDRLMVINAAVSGANVELKMLNKKDHPMLLSNLKDR